MNVVTFNRHERLSSKQRDAVVGRLAEQLGITVKELRKRIQNPRASPFAPVPVAVGVSPDLVAYFKEHEHDFPAVDVRRVAVRSYPLGTLAAHVLGYVGQVNERELETHRGEGYQAGDVIGKDGVEQVFESVLRGQPRYLKLEVDAQGRIAKIIQDRKAIPGNDVQLTIDADVQRVAEESLEQGMLSARRVRDVTNEGKFELFHAGGGSMVVLDANDGSVVAMASAPTYDPSKFATGIPPEEFRKLSDPSSNYPLINRAVQGQYAPGSTFKLITSMAGIESGVLDPNAPFDDKGFLDIAGGTQRRYNAGKKAHGTVILDSALTVSSDVYFYEVGRDMWQLYNKGDLKKGYAIQDEARRYGFGKPTGIGIPGEASGRIPDQKFKADFNRSNPDPKMRREQSLWLPGDSVSLAVGQGDLLVTPIQLATAYATFANGGALYTPRLASALLASGTGSDAPPQVVRELPPVKVVDTGLKSDERDLIMAGLTGAVGNSLGTAHAAFSGFELGTVAGKTGTAEAKPHQDTSLFVGITPVDKPQYVAVSVVEEAGFGSAVAAPTVRRVIEALQGNLNPGPVVARPPSTD
jgi:penicillin-binding protein 2